MNSWPVVESGREDLNLARSFFSPAGRRFGGGVEREQCDFCPFLSHDVDEGKAVLLSVLLSVYGDRFGGPAPSCA